jgi:hypothetical protein
VHVSGSPAQHIGAEQQQRRLRQLGGLKLQRAGTEPSSRSAHPHSDTGDENEEHQGEAAGQGGGCEPAPPVVVDAHGRDHRDGTDDDIDHLPDERVPG